MAQLTKEQAFGVVQRWIAERCKEMQPATGDVAMTGIGPFLAMLKPEPPVAETPPDEAPKPGRKARVRR